MISFNAAVETDFTTSTNLWSCALPNAANPGDYLLAMLASPANGILWSASGWQQLDGFSTVIYTLGAAQSSVQIPISYALFGKFATPVDVETLSATFPVQGVPTSVIGALPGAAAGVAFVSAYSGASPAGPIRAIGNATSTPQITLTYGPNGSAVAPAPGLAVGPIQSQTIAAFTPVTSANVPAIFAEQGDCLIAPLIALSGANITLPGPNFLSRGSTTGGPGIVIGLADEQVLQTTYQNGLAWGGNTIATPLLTEAIALWPNNSETGAPEIVLYCPLDRTPTLYGYHYSDQPTVIVNQTGYRLKVYFSRQASPQAVLAVNLLTSVNLLVTRSDDSTFTQALTVSPDGTYGYCVTGNGWFPYTGRYTLQCQLLWANGATQYTVQSYLEPLPQGGQ